MNNGVKARKQLADVIIEADPEEDADTTVTRLLDKMHDIAVIERQSLRTFSQAIRWFRS
jgi:hypothetical protein